MDVLIFFEYFFLNLRWYGSMGYFGVLMQMEVNYFKKYNNVIVLKKNLNLQCFVVQVKYIFIRFCIEIKKMQIFLMDLNL